MKKPSDNQKHVESLDNIRASIAQPLPEKEVGESKEKVKKLSTVEDLTDSQAKYGQIVLLLALLQWPRLYLIDQ